MQRVVGSLVVLALIGGAVWIGLAFGPSRMATSDDNACGDGVGIVCPDEGVLDIEIVVARCPRSPCTLEPLEREVYLEFVDRDSDQEERCGPGDCGAVPQALLAGWPAGKWKITPPHLEDLLTPAPLNVEVEAGKTLEFRIIYQTIEPELGWGRIPAGDPRICPTGPFSPSPSGRQVRTAAHALLRATNQDRPDPKAAWSLLDRALSDVFGSYPRFAERLHSANLPRSYTEWGVDRRVYLGNPRPLLDLAALCGERVSEAVAMVSAAFPRFKGVSGGVVQLFFVARPAGPKLWFAY